MAHTRTVRYKPDTEFERSLEVEFEITRACDPVGEYTDGAEFEVLGISSTDGSDDPLPEDAEEVVTEYLTENLEEYLQDLKENFAVSSYEDRYESSFEY